MNKNYILISLVFLFCYSINVFAQQARLGISDQDYKDLGIQRGIPEVWEDGIRTTGGKNTYEWWYTDAHLEDGTTVVVVFFTKGLVNIKGKLNPLILVNINFPDGTRKMKIINEKPKQFSAVSDSCDVRIGNSYIRGNMKEYQITVEADDLNLQMHIQNEWDPWRPESGTLFFDEKGSYFSWLVSVPRGKVELNYTDEQNTINSTGYAYHDHNWGNIALPKIIHHWYWFRGKVGPYNIMGSNIITLPEYGNQDLDVIGIMKDGEIIADNPELLEVYRKADLYNNKTKKRISNELLFKYSDLSKGIDYELTLEKKSSLLDILLIPNNFLRWTVKLFTGFSPAYHRYNGELSLKITKNGKLVESYTSEDLVWELMYFGN